MSWSNEVTRQTFTPVSLSTFTAVCQSPLSSLLPLPLNVLSSFHHYFLSKQVHHSGTITHPSPPHFSIPTQCLTEVGDSGPLGWTPVICQVE